MMRYFLTCSAGFVPLRCTHARFPTAGSASTTGNSIKFGGAVNTTFVVDDEAEFDVQFDRKPDVLARHSSRPIVFGS